MTDDQRPFEFEVSLVDGQKIVARIGAAEFESLRDNNSSYRVPAGVDPRQGAANLMFSMLLHRLDQREGATGIKDTDGRNWIVPATSIVAFSYRDLSSPGRASVGFEAIVPASPDDDLEPPAV